MTSGDVQRLEWIEREATRDFFEAAPAELASRYGIETAEIAGTTCAVVAALPDVSVLDRVIGLGIERLPDPDELEAILAFFTKRRASVYAHLAPQAEANGLSAVLRATGFEAGYPWMKFSIEDPAPAGADLPDGLEVAEAAARDAGLCGRLAAEAFEMPPWIAEWIAATVGRPGWLWLVARDRGDPAGVAASYSAGSASWLSFGGVAAAHRGKGIQRVLLRERIAVAARAGCDLVVTETGKRVPGRPDFSYRNILAVGFEERYLRPNLVRRPG